MVVTSTGVSKLSVNSELALMAVEAFKFTLNASRIGRTRLDVKEATFIAVEEDILTTAFIFISFTAPPSKLMKLDALEVAKGFLILMPFASTIAMEIFTTGPSDHMTALLVKE